ncbi:MAG: PAS domain S-box protein [Deltaproteobacteria bacterium]|nr:PAS domain S-box protein [Deltaproteobacteria bacterium]
MAKKPTYEELEQKIKALEEGNPGDTIGIRRDLNHLDARGKELEASEIRYRELFNNMSSGVAIYEARNNGTDFIFKDFNRAGERIEKIKREDLIGKSVLKVFPGVREFGLFDVFRRVWETGKPEQHPVSIYMDERIAGWRDNYVYRLPSGEIVAVYDDVTERKQVEEGLRESEEQKEAILDASIDRIRLVDRDMKIIWANKTTTSELDRTPEELAGKFCYEVLVGRTTPCPECPNQKALKSGKIEQAFIHQKKSTGKTGETYWDSYAIPLKNSSGNIDSFIQTTRDITEAKRAEEALRASEEKYRNLLESTSEGYARLDPELRIIEVNEAFCRMLCYSQDEILGKTPFDLVDEENRDIFLEQTSKISATPHRSYEITLKKKSGEDLHTFFNATTIRDKSGAVVGSFALITDITEKMKAEKERRLLAVAIEQAAETIVITDSEGTIQYINPAFEKVTGYTSEEVMGKNPRILKSGAQDEDFYREMWQAICGIYGLGVGQIGSHRNRSQRKNGGSSL